MSEFSHHLRPSYLGVEIRDFRVTGLPDPIHGSDAVPLRWLQPAVPGPLTERITLNFLPGPDGWEARLGINAPAMIQVVFSDGTVESIVIAPVRRQSNDTYVYVTELPAAIAYAEVIR